MEAGWWWPNRTLIWLSLLLPDLTAVKARWPGGLVAVKARWRRFTASRSASATGGCCGPIQHQLVFKPAAFGAFPPQSHRACSQEDLLRCNITFTQQSKRFSVLLPSLFPHWRSFQNNRMYYLIRVPEKVFFAFIFFHLVLIVSFFVYVLNYYASTNPAAFGMLKNWTEPKMKPTGTTAMLNLEEDDTSRGEQK